MGQDVESYFQEVLATVEQSAEEGSRGEGGALGGRLQQLYSEIVGEIDAGKGRGRAKSRSCCLKAQEAIVFVRTRRVTQRRECWRLLLGLNDPGSWYLYCKYCNIAP